MDCLDKIVQLKKMGKKIGFTCSTFELGPHSGHDVMLMECKQNCDFLIVGLLTDPTISRPEKNKYVDMVIPFDTECDLEDMLKIIMPDVRFCGEEYKGKTHTGSNIEGIKIFYNKRNHSFSSSSLRERVYYAEKNKRA